MANEFTYTATDAAAASTADATDLTTTIATAAAGPAEVRGDSGAVRQQPMGDLIEADRYMAGKAAVADSTKNTVGIRMIQLRSPGGA